ncbi:hypothetical protein M9H77_13102 [Catharanthus roseus]|uniref:Uncharacterized protein n=1 Tax=Catharanthus roseus TaxID=4058 RepID=A0ACC0BJE0_CATRO|nr:hypothetical protein M9H77_13102 [Catharanthus roseus]
MNLNETLQSMQQSTEGLARRFQRVARDVEELKKGKESATIEQRVEDNHGGVHSPHHQRPYDNIPPYGYYDIPVQNSYPFHESGYQGRQPTRGGRRGGLGGGGYNRPQEEVLIHEALYESNLFEDYGENPNIGQAYYGGYHYASITRFLSSLNRDIANQLELYPYTTYEDVLFSYRD